MTPSQAPLFELHALGLKPAFNGIVQRMRQNGVGHTTAPLEVDEIGLSEVVNDDEYVVFSRNGHLIAQIDGRVRSIYIDHGVEDDLEHLRHITRIDLDEWKRHYGDPLPSEFLVQDIAYCTPGPKRTKKFTDPQTRTGVPRPLNGRAEK